MANTCWNYSAKELLDLRRQGVCGYIEIRRFLAEYQISDSPTYEINLIAGGRKDVTKLFYLSGYPNCHRGY